MDGLEITRENNERKRPGTKPSPREQAVNYKGTKTFVGTRGN
jgi:hypothetical protein